jgi:hypothetical protein
MPSFEMELDKKFNKLFPKMKNNNFKMNDLIELKSFIYEKYRNENYNEDLTNIKKAYNQIDYRI